MPGKRSKPSPSPQKSSKQNELTLAEKLQVIKASTEGSSANSIAKQFKIGRATVGRILKSRDELERQAENPEALASKRIKRTTNNDVINTALLEFFRRCRDRNFPLTGPLLQAKAKFFADSFGVSEFAASSGWLQSWKERHNISQQVLSGESAGADQPAAEVWLQQFPTLYESYELQNVFNADETGLFYLRS